MLLDPLLQPLPRDNLLHRFQKDLPASFLLFLVVFGIEKADLVHEVLTSMGKLYFRLYLRVFQILLSERLLGDYLSNHYDPTLNSDIMGYTNM